jgi:hypothetical protein
MDDLLLILSNFSVGWRISLAKLPACVKVLIWVPESHLFMRSLHIQAAAESERGQAFHFNFHHSSSDMSISEVYAGKHASFYFRKLLLPDKVNECKIPYPSLKL